MPGERSLHLKKRKGITMIHTILQSKVLLYLMTATGLLGLLCQIIGNRCYRQFIREAADAQPERVSLLSECATGIRSTADAAAGR